jgi:hypothetical protein
MIGSVGQHPRDDPALVGHPKTLVDAGFLDPRHLEPFNFGRSGIRQRS